MPRIFALDEQETTITVEATDRSVAYIYSNDLVYQRKLERVGCQPYRVTDDGGMFYRIPANQLRITKPPRKLSDEEKQAARELFASLREPGAE